MSQMAYTSNYFSQCSPMYYNSTDQQNYNKAVPSTSNNNNLQQFPNNNSEQFLTLPSQPGSMSLNWGSLNTDVDRKKIIPTSDKDRYLELNKLQQFDSQAWKGIRYKQVLQSCLATPGFTGLQVNDELCHFNKSKDYLASTELVSAGLSNQVLEQRQLLKTGLQTIVDWACANFQNLNPNNLFDKISDIFGPGSEEYKDFFKILLQTYR
nr:uncharacterized protein LOC113400861 isoform X2 [Vanessa tameamea]